MSTFILQLQLLSLFLFFLRVYHFCFWGRIILGITVALIIGIIIGIIFDKKDVLSEESVECEHCHNKKNVKHSLKKDFLKIVKHTAYDLFDVVKYLMFGALIASIIQVMIPRDILTMFNNNQVLSIISLMVFAYLISLCSTSDSFVGKSLLQSFSNASIVAYLLLGPMIDIKNTIVLIGNYKKNFVLLLILLIFVIVFLISLGMVSYL